LDKNEGSIKTIIYMDNSIAICPYCKEGSHHLHSYYQRTACRAPYMTYRYVTIQSNYSYRAGSIIVTILIVIAVYSVTGSVTG
jgi:hypothetical protein